MVKCNQSVSANPQFVAGKSKATRNLMLSASAGVMTMIMASAVQAQILPAECAPNPLIDGGSATCVAPAPTIIDPIETDRDDATIIIGDQATPTTVADIFLDPAIDGIHMEGAGNQALIIVNDGSLVAGGQDGADVSVTGGAGSLRISNAGNVVGQDHGIYARHDGVGDISIQSANASGVNGGGIDAQITNGINTGDITIISQDSTSGGGSGIRAINLGDGSVSVTAGDVIGAVSLGINAQATGGGVTVDSSAGKVTGNVAGIYARDTGTGAVSVIVADVTGITASSVRASSHGGGVMVDSTAGTLTGGFAGLIARDFEAGAVSVTTADVTGTSFNGISALSSDGGIMVDSTAGTVTGEIAGISARDFGVGAVFVTTADVTGTASNGIFARSDGGGVTIDSSAGSVSGTSGIGASDLGAGAVSVTTADVNGTASNGIFASSDGGGITVDSSAGVVTGATRGIDAQDSGGGAVSITTADVNGTTSVGIFANSLGGDIIVDSGAGAVMGGNSGIAVQSSGAVSVTTADVTGTAFNGIFAESGGGGITVDSGAGTVTGGTIGIFARDNGAGAVSVTTADVIGAAEDGIVARTSTGDILVNTSAGLVTGGATGLSARAISTGAISVITGNVTGTTGPGIIARSQGGSVTVDSSAGTVTGDLSGISASSGNSAVSVIAADVSSASDIGIFASSNGGGILVDSRAGSVSGELNGIQARDIGAGLVSVMTADVSATGENGIFALSNGGGLAVDSTAGTVTGEEDGITVRDDGAGAVSVTTADVTGVTEDGIDARSNGGGITIDSSAGTVTGAIQGIVARETGNGAVSITTADVSGGGNGILIETAGGQATVNNSGTIMGGGFAIATTNASLGNVAINNSGTIMGGVSLGVGDDAFTNNATFNVIGDSDFGGGNDVFANAGAVNVFGSANFAGLEQFSNSGSVTMIDGATDDIFSVSGDYVGNGGTLGLDVSFGQGGSNDQLVIDGAATGNTRIILNGFDALQNFGTALTLVDAGAGSDAGAFELDGGDIVSLGFLNVALTFDAANNDFLLDSAIGAPVFQATKFAEGAQSLWYRSADAWAGHVTSKRNADYGKKSPLWLQLYGATSDREENFDFTSSGFTQNIVLDYSQDYFGLQGGVEFGPGNAGDGVFYGLTTGYLNSNLGFDGTADNVRYDAFNIGAYAGYAKDGFFANGLVKYDFIDTDINSATAGYSANIDSDAFGLRAETGYRWTSGRFFFEPTVAVEYQATNLDSFNVPGAGGAVFDFESFDGLRGSAGFRLGGETKVDGDNTLTYYAGGRVVHEFEGDNDVTFSTPLSSVTMANNPIDTFGRFDLGLNIATKGGVTGFIEGNADISGRFQSFGGRVGLRIAF